MNIKNTLFPAALVVFTIGGGLISATQNTSQEFQDIEKTVILELFKTNKKIAHLRQKLSLTKKQRKNNEEALTTCRSEQNEAGKNLYFWEDNPINCSAQYKALYGEYEQGDAFCDAKYLKTKLERAVADDLDDTIMVYRRFEMACSRCKDFRDSDCLKDLVEEIREWNKNN